MIRLEDLDRCFHGIIPGVVATASADGTPNVSYLSQVYYVDREHVALSCQFFNKTRQNLDENPYACVEIYDPIGFDAYRLRLRFLRSETTGPLFETMAARIQAIASTTGMAGIFALRSADVFRVESVERREGFLEPEVDEAPAASVLPEGPLTELRGLSIVSERVRVAHDLEALLGGALGALDEVFAIAHSMILLPDDTGRRLVAVAAHGYPEGTIGGEVRIGEGLFGAVAAARKPLRVADVAADLRYGRAIRAGHEEAGTRGLVTELPLSGLPDAQSQLAVPLLVQDRLIGVLALECTHAMTFAHWHEAFLQVLANQIALGIDRMAERDDDDEPDVPAPPPPTTAPDAARRTFTYYRNDDCVFVEGEYLIRNVPAKILWKLLRAHQAEGKREFANRELRLDPTLGLPAFKDNLESRLILLRKRLEQKCPDVRLVPTRRGRFALEVDCAVELVEKETA